MKYADRDRLVAGLREMADFIEKKGLELPIEGVDWKLTQFLYSDSDYWKEGHKRYTAKEKARRAAKALGSAEKKWSDHYLDLRKEFGPVTLEFTISRNAVCERKVVGTKFHEEQVIAAYEEEIVEWECNESILA